MRQNRPTALSDTALEAAYYYLGESYGKLAQPGLAITALEKALSINAVDADALYLLGVNYHATGQPEAAVQQYARAVRLVPDFVEAYQGMRESYQTLGQLNHALYARGMTAFGQGRYRTAVNQLEKATRALPDFAPGFLGLGLAYEQLGKLTDALSALQRAIALDPDDFSAQQALGRIQSTINSQD